MLLSKLSFFVSRITIFGIRGTFKGWVDSTYTSEYANMTIVNYTNRRYIEITIRKSDPPLSGVWDYFSTVDCTLTLNITLQTTEPSNKGYDGWYYVYRYTNGDQMEVYYNWVRDVDRHFTVEVDSLTINLSTFDTSDYIDYYVENHVYFEHGYGMNSWTSGSIMEIQAILSVTFRK